DERFDDVVAVDAVLAGGESIPAALHVPSNTDVLASATGHMQPVILEHRVEMPEIRPRADGGPPPVVVDDDIREPAEVDDEAVVDGETCSAVAARPERRLDVVLARKAQARGDIAERLAVRDGLRE